MAQPVDDTSIFVLVLGPAAIIAILTAIGLYLKNRPKNGDTRGKSR